MIKRKRQDSSQLLSDCCPVAQWQDNQAGGNQGGLSMHSYQHYNMLPPLSDAYEKSSREFEDLFDIDIDTLPASFFAEALGSLMGEQQGISSEPNPLVLNDDLFLDTCSSRCFKRCYSAPPSPLAGLLGDFDEPSSIAELMNDTNQMGAEQMLDSVSSSTSLVHAAIDEPPVPWASLSTNDVINVLEAASERLENEHGAEISLQHAIRGTEEPQMPRPPSCPPPTCFQIRSVSEEESLSGENAEVSRTFAHLQSSDWPQTKRPRSTVPTAGSLIIPVSTIRKHDIVRSRLASFATRRLRDKQSRMSCSSDRSPVSIHSDNFPYAAEDIRKRARNCSSSSTPTVFAPINHASSLANLLNNNQSSASNLPSSSSLSLTNGATCNGDLYWCFYPSCTLSYDRSLRLHAHLLHHVYGFTGPYRCDIPNCPTNCETSDPKASKLFPTTKQLWAHIESDHKDVISNRVNVQPSDYVRQKCPKCPQCSASFFYPFQLYLHLRAAHVKPFHRIPSMVNKRGRFQIDKTHTKTESSSSPYLCRLCNFQSTTMSGLLLHIQRRQHRPSGNRGMSRSQLATSLEPTSNHCSVTSTQLPQSLPQQQQPRLVFRSSKSTTTTNNTVNGSASVAAFQNGHQLATSAGDVIYVLNPVKTLPQQQQQQQQQQPKLSGEKSPFYQIQRVVLVNVSH